MTIDYRTRNIVIAAVLAAAAVLLTVLYVSSARKHDEKQTQSVTVYVPTKSYPLGTAGTKVANNLRAETVSRSILVPEAVTSPDQIRSLYTTEPIYSGEQLTLKRFAPPAEQGIRSKLTGTQRAFQISGDTNQLLAGTLVPGDRVDVIVNLRNPDDNNDVRSFIALRSLRVLQTDKGDGGAKITRSTNDDHAVIVAVTDEQAQRLQYVTQNSSGGGSSVDSWRLQLRPVKKPRDSKMPAATFASVMAGAVGAK